jgi:beta-N-acetylhexosaminidase
MNIKKFRLYLISLTILIAACDDTRDKQSEADIHLNSGLNKSQQQWVETTLSELSIREMAGQVIMDWFGGSYTPVESEAFDRETGLMESGLGGVWFMGGSPLERAAKANALQEHAEVPLLVTGFESFGKKFLQVFEVRRWARGGGTDFPPALAYGAIGDPELVKESARINGLELLATGNHIGNPEGAVLVNLENVLHNRCFGDDPEQVAELVTAFIKGLNEVGALAITGFYPGPGNIDKDPHIDLPIMYDERASYDSIHFVPLKAAIEAGTDLMMSGHNTAPGLTGLDSLPVTLSPEAIRILREELGYDGVVMTDAMAMGAITSNYEFTEAAVMAFKAGHDIILGPSPIKFADTLAILVENGNIPLEQLKTSVRRILELKASMGLHDERMVDLDRINKIVGHREHQRSADSAASLSIVLLRNQHQYVPVDISNTKKVLSISYDRDSPYAELLPVGIEFNRMLRNHIERVDALRLYPSSDPSAYQKLLKKSEDADMVILSIYLRPQLGKRIQDRISEPLIQYVEKLQSEGKEVIVVSFGELEVLNYLPGLGTLMMAWSGQEVMQRAAAKAVLGIQPISGHLPVNLPPFHKRGEGLQIVFAQ